jgi:hypothetical protein
MEGWRRMQKKKLKLFVVIDNNFENAGEARANEGNPELLAFLNIFWKFLDLDSICDSKLYLRGIPNLQK